MECWKEVEKGLGVLPLQGLQSEEEEKEKEEEQEQEQAEEELTPKPPTRPKP